MSYENYARTAKHYDSTRQPIGLEIILGCLVTMGKPLDGLRVLDAGCGTGSYCLALSDYVGRIEGIETCPEMLAEAKRKAAKADRNELTFCQGTVMDLPYGKGEFDAVIVNQVLHHLDDGESEFVNTDTSISEFARVTKPRGKLILNRCTSTQLRHGWWYRSLIPDAYERCARRHISTEDLTKRLQKHGYEIAATIVPVDALFQGQAYFEPLGLLSEGWRSGDSVFSLATAGELSDAEEQLMQLSNAGTLEAFVSEQDEQRLVCGQVTFIEAILHRHSICG